VRHVEVESRKAGYLVMVCDSQEDGDIEQSAIKILVTRQVDGMIICPIGKKSKYIEDLVNQDIPIVMADRCFPTLDISHVSSDNYNGALEAIKYFIDNGHQKIAFIQGFTDSSVNKDRIRGYRDAHQMNNLPLDESLIVGERFGEHSGYIGTKILMSSSERPTGILAGSSLVSLGAMRAIWEEKLKIPNDISMIAFDDHPYSSFLYTPMTTVKQKLEDIGKISIKLLLDEITSKNGIEKKGIIIPTELVVRKSVKSLI